MSMTALSDAALDTDGVPLAHVPRPEFFQRLGLYASERFLDADLCRQLRAALGAGSKRAGTVGIKGSADFVVDATIRSVRWVSVDDALASTVRDRLIDSKPALESFYEMSLTGLEPLQFLAYGVGDHYAAHRDSRPDASASDTSKARRVSAVLFLNEQSEQAAPQRYGAPLVARAATRKALLYLDAPDADAALRWADRAQAACATPCPLDATLDNLRAHVALERGAASEALSWSTRAAARSEEASAERANALRLSGRAQHRLGQHDAAAAALAQALAIDRKLGFSDRVALDLMAAADNEAARGDVAAAREFHLRAIDVYQASGNAQAADAVRRRLDTPAARR